MGFVAVQRARRADLFTQQRADPAEAFRAFVLKFGADDRSYEGDPMVLTKVM